MSFNKDFYDMTDSNESNPNNNAAPVDPHAEMNKPFDSIANTSWAPSVEPNQSTDRGFYEQQAMVKADSTVPSVNENAPSPKASPFYTESYVKPGKKKRNGILQMVLVAVMSSVLTTAAAAVFFVAIAPQASEPVKSYFDSFLPSSDKAQNALTKTDSGVVKKVEIEKSDSPIVAIAEKVGPAVVGIRVTARTATFFGAMDSNPEGSGIIIRKDGYIMTNNHVIEAALGTNTNKIRNGSKIEVILPSSSEKTYEAQVIGRDQRTDLAVLKIDGANLPVVEMGDSDKVKVGELAVAIGNPGGMEYMGSVTAGIISGLNRKVPVEDGKELKLIQTDAAINPGNSGGALVDAQGKLIGVNTAKIGGEGYEGLGFAIPINKAKEITNSLIEFKYVKGRPMLGIAADPDFDQEMADQYGVPLGVLVSSVTPFSGASKAGIQINDIITKINGKTIKNIDELNEVKNKLKPGDTVTLEVYRDGENQTVQVKLTEENARIK